MQCSVTTICKVFPPFCPHYWQFGQQQKNLWHVCSSSPLELSCCACTGESNLIQAFANIFFCMIAFAVSMLCFNSCEILDIKKECWSRYVHCQLGWIGWIVEIPSETDIAPPCCFHALLTQLTLRTLLKLVLQHRCVFLRKKCFLLDFVQMRGGALPKFFGTFSRIAFLVNKGVYFFQNANNLNFKLFLGCIHKV